MSDILLTQYNGAILKYIAKALGWITNWIYTGLSFIGIENIGVAIIVLTIVIYTCMLPLTIRQQKFSMMSRKMNPEVKAIQEKYKGKKDQASLQKMNEETQAVYAKYGVSPMGSCAQLLITMPILLALYRVIYNIPAYVFKVKDEFSVVVDGIVGTDGFADKMAGFVDTMKLGSLRANFVVGEGNTIDQVKNFVIDVIYKMDTTGWDGIRDLFSSDSTLVGNITSLQERMAHLNTFIVLNISDSPLKIIPQCWKQMISGGASTFFSISLVTLLCCIAIPFLSYFSQVLNIKLMPQPDASSAGDQQAQSMKMMNNIMPLFSLVMCFTVPVGLGIYWVASAVVRLVQQVLINKYLDKHEAEIMKKNEIKAKKKMEKRGIYQERIRQAAQMSGKKDNRLDKSMSSDEKKSRLQQAYEAAQQAQTKNPKSMTAKANLVKQFNEKNNK